MSPNEGQTITVALVYEEETDFGVLHQKYCVDPEIGAEVVMLAVATLRNILQYVVAYQSLAANYAYIRTDLSDLQTKLNNHIFNLPPRRENVANVVESETPEMEPISSEAEKLEVEKNLEENEYVEIWVSFSNKGFFSSCQQLRSNLLLGSTADRTEKSLYFQMGSS